MAKTKKEPGSNRDLTPALPESVGVCIKSQNETVEFQNQSCLDICGDQLGRRCEKGCMERYLPGTTEDRIFDNAFRVFRNVKIDSRSIDAIMINDGTKLTTLLCDRSAAIEKQLEYLKKFKLSKAEQKVAELYLMGLSNSEIATKLFISKGTLRTHLNTIYKKIPEDLKRELMSSHSAFETKQKMK